MISGTCSYYNVIPLHVDPVDVILFTVGVSVSAEAYDSLWLHVHVCTVPACTVFHRWVLDHCAAHWLVLSHCCPAFQLVVTCSVREKAIANSDFFFLKTNTCRLTVMLLPAHLHTLSCKCTLTCTHTCMCTHTRAHTL